MHIELSYLTKHFGRTKALEAVNLNVPPSSIIAVLGENGAGKSTLLRLMAGVYMPDKGLIRMDGHDFSREKIELRKRILYTPDTPLLFADQTVARNVAMFAGIYGVSLEGRGRTAQVAAGDWRRIPDAEDRRKSFAGASVEDGAGMRGGGEAGSMASG